jgi:hypothetical protein
MVICHIPGRGDAEQVDAANRGYGEAETNNECFEPFRFFQRIHLAFHFLRVTVSPFPRAAWLKGMTNYMDKRIIVTYTFQFNPFHA